MPQIEMVKITADELRKLISRTGRSRKEIAGACGISTNAIKKWVSNEAVPKRSYDILKQMEGEEIEQTLMIDTEDEKGVRVVKGYKGVNYLYIPLNEGQIQIPLGKIIPDEILLDEIKRRFNKN